MANSFLYFGATAAVVTLVLAHRTARVEDRLQPSDSRVGSS